MKQYFYQFASGSYSGYSTGELCVCDHEVTEQEWDEFYKLHRDACRELADKVPRTPVGSFDRTSTEYKIYLDKYDNDPEKQFQVLHNMQVVEFTELWRDS